MFGSSVEQGNSSLSPQRAIPARLRKNQHLARLSFGGDNDSLILLRELSSSRSRGARRSHVGAVLGNVVKIDTPSFEVRASKARVWAQETPQWLARKWESSRSVRAVRLAIRRPPSLPARERQASPKPKDTELNRWRQPSPVAAKESPGARRIRLCLLQRRLRSQLLPPPQRWRSLIQKYKVQTSPCWRRSVNASWCPRRGL